jgi:hypothetical protein
VSKTKEEKLVAAICLVNDFFTEHGLPAPIEQSAALVILRRSQQEGPEMTRAVIEALIRTEPKPLTKRVQ